MFLSLLLCVENFGSLFHSLVNLFIVNIYALAFGSLTAILFNFFLNFTM